MSRTLYNPCSDGLAAKAWECLRRNSAFRGRADRFKKIRSEKNASEAVLLQQAWLARIQHRLAEVAFSHLFPVDLEKCRLLPVRFDVDTTWPKTSCRFRADFSACLKPRVAGEKIDPWAPPSPSLYVLPTRIEPPPKGIIGRLTSEEGRDELAAWLLQWEPSLKTGAWSIPRKILDPAHRKAVLGELEKAVPKAELRADPNSQKGSGKFGSKADWDTWLLISELQAGGLSLLKAEYQAAWKRFASESYNECPANERLLKESERVAEAVHERNAHHITKSRQAVDVAIQLIYPTRKS